MLACKAKTNQRRHSYKCFFSYPGKLWWKSKLMTEDGAGGRGLGRCEPVLRDLKDVAS